MVETQVNGECMKQPKLKKIQEEYDVKRPAHKEAGVIKILQNGSVEHYQNSVRFLLIGPL
ncbi:hypothetical protein ACAD15_002410 [Enterobacter bugandensis]